MGSFNTFLALEYQLISIPKIAWQILIRHSHFTENKHEICFTSHTNIYLPLSTFIAKMLYFMSQKDIIWLKHVLHTEH
jgi:hypothetical protein